MVSLISIFRLRGVLRSKEIALFTYIHRGHSDEAYVRLFGLTPYALLEKETVFQLSNIVRSMLI